MKLAATLLATALIASPLAAAKSNWTTSITGGVREYHVGAPGPKGTSMILSCPAGKLPWITVQINGVLPPSGEQVGFNAGGHAVALRTGDSGSIKVNTQEDRAAFRTLWSSIRAGSSIRISYTNGVEAGLSLLGSAKALPAAPCGI